VERDARRLAGLMGGGDLSGAARAAGVSPSDCVDELKSQPGAHVQVEAVGDVAAMAKSSATQMRVTRRRRRKATLPAR
jgi:hypothetical protein